MLPDLSGFDVANDSVRVPSKIVLVSSRGRDDFGPRLRQSRVTGFISKDELSGERIRELLEQAT